MNRQTGLTLIELIVVVAIIGILAGVAWPLFQRYERKVSRADAITGIEMAANELESCFAKTFNYNDLDADGNSACPLTIVSSPRNRYTIAKTASTTNSYTLTATKNGAADPECAGFTLDNLGQQGTTGGTGTVKYCWSQ